MKNSAEYREILRDVLKHQIQVLIDQLCDQVGTDSVLLVSDSSGNHIGSCKGKIFLAERGEIAADFNHFCSQEYAVPGTPDEGEHTHSKQKRAQNKRLSGNQHSGNLEDSKEEMNPAPLIKTEYAVPGTLDEGEHTHFKQKRTQNKRISGNQHSGNLEESKEELNPAPLVKTEPEPEVEELLKWVRHCEVCGYKSRFSSNFKRHLHTQHGIGSKETPTKMFQCHYCRYFSKFKSNIQRHLRKVHNADLTAETLQEHASILEWWETDDVEEVNATDSSVDIYEENTDNLEVTKSFESSVSGISIPDGMELPETEDSNDLDASGQRTRRGRQKRDSNDSLKETGKSDNVCIETKPAPPKCRKVGIKCNYCHDIFSDFNVLKIHIDKVHFGGTDGALKC